MICVRSKILRLRALCPVSTSAAVLALSLSACASPEAEPATELSSALQVAREATRDASLGTEAIARLEAFVRRYPTDAGVPAALKQMAMLRQQQDDMAAAIADYERILASFPACDVADEAQFMIAFIREEHLADLDGARVAYQAVIDNYPESELAGQARTLLAHVGQSPDEYIKFQEDVP